MTEHVAVIGSGMAGLTAAHILRASGRSVTVFEAAAHPGMAAQTVDMLPAGWVDVPLRVMTETGWKSVLALCNSLGVGTFPIDCPVSFSWNDGSTWFRTGTIQVGGRLFPSLGSLRFINRSAIVIGRDLRRLARDLDHSPPEHETLAEFFTSRNYSPIFWQGFIFPLLGTITTCSKRFLLDYPAANLLVLLRDILFGSRMRRLQGGTRALVSKLAEDLNWITGSPVVSLTQNSSGVTITNARGEKGEFARVVIAAQANHMDFLATETYAREQNILKHFVFDQGELVVHTDPSCMPERKSDWAPLNYRMDKDFKQDMFTVWVNPIEPSLKSDAPLFQSWNPTVTLDPSKIMHRVTMQRAVVRPEQEKHWQALSDLHRESDRRVYFCGAWASAGVPLLESAVRSAINVARLMNVNVAWDPK